MGPRRFPSLSESSGFPTYVHYGDEIDPTLFPSLSESSGFPTPGVPVETGIRSYWFPSLSESSGFPT